MSVEFTQEELETGEIVFVGREKPAAADFWSFTTHVEQASEAGDIDTVQSLLSSSLMRNLAGRYAFSMEETRRVVLSEACQSGSVPLVSYLLDDGGQLGKMCISDCCRAYSDSDVVASPLWIAARNGESDLVQMLIVRGADAGLAASDGTTPFYAACQADNVEVLRSLHACSVDMEQPEEPGGTSPVHIAAAEGSLDALRFLHEHGVNMDIRGSINLPLGEDGTDQLVTGVTALAIAQMLIPACDEDVFGMVAQYLEGIAAAPVPASAAQPGKRHRSSASTYDRAMSLGIIDRLREIPLGLHELIESGSDLEKKSAKKELHKLQKGNQQIVARAEQSRLKQAKLSFHGDS